MKLLVSLLLLVSAFGLQAEVYKWVDDDGTVHYGDMPESGDAVQMHIDSPPASQPTADIDTREERRQRISDSLEEDRLAKQKEREKKKLEREKMQKECNWLRDRQRRLQRASGMYQLDKDGNRVFMSNDARQKSEQQLARRIKKVCH